MGNVIIIAILLVIVFFAICSSARHMKGEGGCCGGDGVSKKDIPVKILDGNKLGEKLIKIKGMHCMNCVMSITKSLNCIDGVAATVDLKKKQALVIYDRLIDEEDLRMAITRLGFEVESIEDL